VQWSEGEWSGWREGKGREDLEAFHVELIARVVCEGDAEGGAAIERSIKRFAHRHQARIPNVVIMKSTIKASGSLERDERQKEEKAKTKEKRKRRRYHS